VIPSVPATGSAPRAVAVVGASSGLGAALALVHAARGDLVVALARREDRLERLRTHVLATSPTAKWVSLRADLCDPDDLEAIASQLEDVALDRVYLNAAATPPDLCGGPPERLATIEAFHRLLFAGHVVLTETLVERGTLSPTSRVVAISSLAATIPFPELELYSAGKAALEAWCRTARHRGGPRFTIVRPGVFTSEFFGPAELEVSSLPTAKAVQIAQLVDAGRDFVDIGGWRDVLASRLSSLIGPGARAIVAPRDLRLVLSTRH
jgi:NAD(P)-dependent dehydrogenase (short-subunit alcohol dehydrogenase family)